MASTASVTPPPALWQGSLFGVLVPRLADLDLLRRVELDTTSWIDLGVGIVEGADELFETLHRNLPWQAFERPMYDRMVAVPRLSAFVAIDDERLPALVGEIARALGRHYGEDFDRVGANLYRDGDDSVAWHSDRIGRTVSEPLIGILSLGAPRSFRLRPKAGGRATGVRMHGGDLLVMGGACQHRWEHCVPKVAHAQPRMSITFRHDRVPFSEDDPIAVAVPTGPSGRRPRPGGSERRSL